MCSKTNETYSRKPSLRLPSHFARQFRHWKKLIFKLKLTPEHDEPEYTQGPPTPIHYRDEVLVELVLLQYWGVITKMTLNGNTPASSLKFENILAFLQRTNHLNRHDYDNHNFPIATIAGVRAHLTGKKFFAKLECSHAYHELEIADPLSVQLLFSNFLSRTFLYLRLAQGLSRSIIALVLLCVKISTIV